MSPSDKAFDIRKAPVSRVLVPLVCGVLAGGRTFIPIRGELACAVTMVLWAGMFIFFRLSSTKKQHGHLIFAGLSLCVFLGTGLSIGCLAKPEDPGLPVGERIIVRGRVVKAPIPSGRGWRMELKLQMLAGDDSWSVKSCMLMTTMGVLPGGTLPALGEQWQLAGQLLPIRNRGNPGEIDYAAIMARKGYWYRFFVDNGVWNREVYGGSCQRFRVERIREHVTGHWTGEQEAVSLLRAICLGDRSGLTDDQKQAYRGAGGMHLLAVSGLHVGLIWWVLHHAFSVLVRVFHREIYRTLPILFLLWFYAYVTGFSSSVCRSVTMFTLFSLSRLTDRRSQPVNCILVSAFLMIVIDPNRIRDVGFQLSYAAILGIATLFPWLRDLPGKTGGHPLMRLITWTWEATAVSVAAQVATAPLVVFYFHQYPVYALLTNLVAVPMLSILMALFVISMPFFQLGLLTSFLNRLMVTMASLMNHIMEKVAGLPGAVIDGLYPDRGIVILLLVAVCLGILWIRGGPHWPGISLVLVAALITVWNSFSIQRRKNTRSLQVTHFNRGSQLIFMQGQQVDCYRCTPDSSVRKGMDQYLAGAWGGAGYQILVTNVSDTSACRGRISACHPVAPGLWLVGNDLVRGWVVTGTPDRKILELLLNHPGNFILFSGNPGIPLDLMKKLSARSDLILDGSNGPWYLEEMTGRISQIYSTLSHGAYLKTW